LENVLSIKRNDYAVLPQSKILALSGTKTHSRLDKYTPAGSLSEKKIFNGVSAGSFDFYDAETKTLYDDKTYGSYAAMKTLGLKEKWVVAGTKADGKPNWAKEIAPGRRNRWALAYQLNDYRMKLESEGYPVDSMICEILVRDAGTKVAKERGITTNAILVRINRISDRWLSRYMQKKADDLHKYLASEELPPRCRPKERWYNPKNKKSKKCAEYCDVRKVCPYGEE
jgi:hypothetical protein